MTGAFVPLWWCTRITGQGFARRCRWLRDASRSRLQGRGSDPCTSRPVTSISSYGGISHPMMQRVIARAREIIACGVNMLRQPVPSTFLPAHWPIFPCSIFLR